jgi:hypothetical protein
MIHNQPYCAKKYLPTHVYACYFSSRRAQYVGTSACTFCEDQIFFSTFSWLLRYFEGRLFEFLEVNLTPANLSRVVLLHVIFHSTPRKKGNCTNSVDKTNMDMLIHSVINVRYCTYIQNILLYTSRTNTNQSLTLSVPV